MNAPCTFLQWDTDFFGVRIGCVNTNYLTPSLAQEIDAWCQENAIDCLYFLANTDDPETTRLAEDEGFRLQDVRVTFQRMLDAPIESAFVARPAQENDMPTLLEIARHSYTDTRFYYDPCFPDEKCAELYETWVKKSREGYADEVLVIDYDGQPAGFIICHVKSGYGEIGLVGVAENARGKSIGQGLVKNALQWFYARQLPHVNVVTQGRNLAAQRLYQRCGFYTYAVQLWYHKWFQGCQNRADQYP